ncbi:MAG: hypothetical protein LC753_03310 [Acidobacteria bacterium]|nr:hypothetical protein [Acidobacteriota bacterium]
MFQYLTQPTIRAGVESVLDFGAKKLPPGLQWDELSQFYHASLAGSSVQTDWAITLDQLWRAVWPSSVPGWVPLSLDEQNLRDYDAPVSLEKCWTEEWFGRCFTRPRPTTSAKTRRQPADDVLCLSVSLRHEGVAAGVSLDSALGSSGPDDDGFHFDSEYESWWTPEFKIASPHIDLSPLKIAAAAALKWVARQTP